MVPSFAQVAPNDAATSHSVWRPPPVERTFFSFPPAKKPIQLPSGEKNGALAPSVPASNLTSMLLMGRTNNCRPTGNRLAVYASTRPSGESAMDGRISPIVSPAGSETLSRATGDGRGTTLGFRVQAASPATSDVMIPIEI